MLADSAVVVEELWGQGIDYARLNHSMISFFNFSKLETAASRWSLVRLNASKVGKGLSKDSKAQKLDFQHWIEAKKAPFQKHREEEVKKKVWLLIGPLKPVGLLTQHITHTPKIDYECSFFLLGKLYDSEAC